MTHSDDLVWYADVTCSRPVLGCNPLVSSLKRFYVRIATELCMFHQVLLPNVIMVYAKFLPSISQYIPVVVGFEQRSNFHRHCCSWCRPLHLFSSMTWVKFLISNLVETCLIWDCYLVTFFGGINKFKNNSQVPRLPEFWFIDILPGIFGYMGAMALTHSHHLGVWRTYEVSNGEPSYLSLFHSGQSAKAALKRPWIRRSSVQRFHCFSSQKTCGATRDRLLFPVSSCI